MSFRKSIRKSLRLKKYSQNGYTSSSSLLVQKKHLSLSARTASLRNVSITTTPPEAIAQMSDADFEHFEPKPATIKKHHFFSKDSTQEHVAFKAPVEIKTQEFVPGPITKSSFKSKTMREKKEAGTICIGDGLVLLQSTQTQKFEIHHLQHINLPGEKSKILNLFFKFENKTVSLKFEEAETAQLCARELFIQARQTCDIFSKQLKKILPLDWSRYLESDSDVAMRLDDALSPADLPTIPEDEADMAEIILRELVDLSGFGRGRSDMDHVGSCEQLARWLKNSNRASEAKYWEEFTRKAKSVRDGKRRKELGDGKFLGKNLNHRATIIEKIRNPVEKDALMNLRVKSIPKNVESRLLRLETSLKLIQLEGQGKTAEEKFESLI